MTRADLYLQGPGLALAVAGNAVARGYFRREYGEVAAGGAAGPPPALEATFARAAARAPDGPVARGRHKLARWRIGVTLRQDAPAALRADVRGPFGLPLVQSLVLEPLLGAVAARHGTVLVPAALLVDGAGAGVLLVGSSGAGKTTLAARTLAAGGVVVADDRVFVDAGAAGSRFARRMRLYPDIRATAPAAWEALAPAARARLQAVAALRRATAGRLAPPVAVARRELGAAAAPPTVAIARILLLGRHGGADARLGAVSSDAAVQEIARRVGDDRAALAAAGLGAELGRAAGRERAILEAAVPAATAQRLELPADWGAARSVERLADELGLA